jgi:endonuclease/exonuclease/phosphatase (EEP) superfamily protein YafD
MSGAAAPGPWRRRLEGALHLILLGVAVSALAALVDRLSPYLETVGQFRAPVLTVAAVAGLIAAALRRPGLLAGFLAAGLALGLSLAPQWAAPARPAAAGVRPVRVYFNNLSVQNRDVGLIARSITAADADVVALVDVTDVQAAGLRQVLKAYPYHLVSPAQFNPPDKTVTVIASRLPLRRGAGALIETDMNGLVGEIDGPRPFRLAVVHLARPWPFFPPSEQLRQFKEIEAWIADPEFDRTLVVGDFNATAASAAMRDFRKRAQVTVLPARLGDWPATLPAPLRIAIENAVAGPGLVLGGRRLGLATGSDHAPILFDVAPAAAATPGSRP